MTEVRGTPKLYDVNGKNYWYDIYRTGSTQHRTYIGEDTPELRTRLEQVARIKAEAAEGDGQRTRLVRLLRAEGLAPMDGGTGSLLAAMARIGVFRLGGTVIGTQAFKLYEAELGVKLGYADFAMTGDVDIASFERLSVALEDTVTEPLNDVLGNLSFDPVPSIDKGKVWRWRQTRRELLVEFLTPSFEADEGLKPLPSLGVSAQSLHYLNFLLARPIPAVGLYRSGVLVQIPRPEAFAIHKLIVAARREGRDAIKARKDRAQAALLIAALAEDRPGELAEAWEEARAGGAKWCEKIDATLARMPETRALLTAL
ncbi:GSU2403 family nucleotidyltransferase fold protein [Oceanicola sp. 502str15]|uniref:nucleotidyltransferase family protein n=1 Tax=Oceanicola sp. 502str15 TaxID=2696061 RepID=UPI003531D2B5